MGSSLISHLNAKGIRPQVLIRSLNENWRNVAGLSFDLLKDKSAISHGSILIHLGANANTREPMSRALWENNVDYTLALRELAVSKKCRFIYASSASVYGAEEVNFAERVAGLKPLNAYAMTKWAIDNHFFGLFGPDPALNTYGLRFFNVYGPREGQKGEMASVIHKAFNKVSSGLTFPSHDIYTEFSNTSNGSFSRTKPHWCLFKSYRDGVKDGEQVRDFIAVSDVVKVISHFIDNTAVPGIYNVGSGRATTFNEVVKAIDPTLPIEYREMPADLQKAYQYHTKADLTRLRAAGYNAPFLTVEEGIKEMKKDL